MSYVYVMRGLESGLVKVGRSITPRLRSAGVAVEVGERVEIMAVFACQDAKSVESAVHVALAPRLRRRKEWFEVEHEEASALIRDISGSQPIATPKNRKILTIRASEALERKIDGLRRREKNPPSATGMLVLLVERAYAALETDA